MDSHQNSNIAALHMTEALHGTGMQVLLASPCVSYLSPPTIAVLIFPRSPWTQRQFRSPPRPVEGGRGGTSTAKAAQQYMRRQF